MLPAPTLVRKKMTIIAADGKDFKRPKVVRNEVGEIKEVLKDEGFYSPFGVTLEIDDEKKLRTSLKKAFVKLAPSYKITLRRPFCSSKFLVEDVFGNNYAAAISFLHTVLEAVQHHITKVHYNWIILPAARTPTVRVGGSFSASKDIEVSKFKRDLGNIFPALCAWSYARKHGFDFESALIDGFQGKTTNAWEEFRSRAKVRVFPKGDECSAPICLADIFLFLTDKKLYAEKRKLFRDQVETIWPLMKFEVSSFYFDETNLNAIRWLDEEPLKLWEYYARPMTYLLVDKQYLAEPTATEEETPTYKDFLTTRGFHELPILLAQELGGAVKGYHPRDDPKTISDGDYLIYMGENSRRVAEGFQDALDLTIMSVKELRADLRKKGYNC